MNGIFFPIIIVVILLIFIVYMYGMRENEEVNNFQHVKLETKKALCLLCYKPNDIWINFLSKFINYDIYIIVDDNEKDDKELYSNYQNINIIQITNEDCKMNGFININFTINKLVSAWEKAIYYFSTLNTKYKNIWFIEDDVFFYDESTLFRIDSKYENTDLLSSRYIKNNGEKNDWHWNKINIKFEPPYYCAMVCCVRMSSKLLSKIKQYANKYKTLFFLEALFPTICKKYKLSYETPMNFTNIVYKKDYKDQDFDKINLYHPVKDIEKHIYYREILEIIS